MFIAVQNTQQGQVLVAHTCNPSYSGGRDQEDCGSKPPWANTKPPWANSSWDPILKTPNTKRAGGVAQGIGPEFKLQYWKNNKTHTHTHTHTQISG
jgi:hypothetical protein